METTIGARLKELRKTLRLTQAEFGERIGVKTAAVGNWEIERQQIPDARIVQICTVFGACREWLETGSGEMFAPEPSEQDKIKDAILLLYRQLDKDAQAAFIDAIRELKGIKAAEKSTEKTTENSPTISGDKNVVNYGTINGGSCEK